MAIKSFRHKGLQRFFETGSLAGVQPAHRARLTRVLQLLHAATSVEEMKIPGFGLHPLHGNQAGRYAVSVSGNWRVTFEFSATDAVSVDYEDYH